LFISLDEAESKRQQAEKQKQGKNSLVQHLFILNFPDELAKKQASEAQKLADQQKAKSKN
jgi:hypothetical protein